jgi:uncharacterized membrane protein
MLELYKIEIAWCVVGFIGAALYLYAEHLAKETVTLKDIIYISVTGTIFGVFMFVIAFALFAHVLLNRLSKKEILTGRKKKKDQ